MLSDTFFVNIWYALLPFLVVALAIHWFVGRVDPRDRYDDLGPDEDHDASSGDRIDGGVPR